MRNDLPEVILTISEEDELLHIMIGEAAMNVVFSREEISLGNLLNQLQAMASSEEDDERLLCIWKARKWLLEYKQVTNPLTATDSWLSSFTPQQDPDAKESDIRFRPTQERDKSKR